MKKTDRVLMHVVAPRELRRAMETAAADRLISMNAYIRQAVKEQLRRDRQRSKRDNILQGVA